MRIAFTLYILGGCVSLVWTGVHPDGISEVSREQDALGNYQFSYSVSSEDGGHHFRKEGTDPLGRVVGSYGLARADGTQRVVDYIADKDGFRAEIRSNEPGTVEASPDGSKTAEASLDGSGTTAFGTRLKTDGSRVSYVGGGQGSHVEDYRPLNPVAYYPGSDDSRPAPSDTYQPPLDPNSALRRTPYLGPRPTDGPSASATSRRPYLPPYGGFDDDPPLTDRGPGQIGRPGRPDLPSLSGRPDIPLLPGRPDIPSRPGRPELSVPVVRGGTDGFLPPRSPAYGAGRYPSSEADLPIPRFPTRSGFPPRSDFPPRISFATPIGPPSQFRPNFVLRAVPIPNGIQAVQVDPETGRVLGRLTHPMFLRDGEPVYDTNILQFDDDLPFSRRTIRNPVFDDDGETRNATGIQLDLGAPTARELAWLRRQLSRVEGFDRSRFSNTPFGSSLSRDFDEEVEGGPIRDSEYSRDNSVSGELGRLFDGLNPEDTREVASKSGDGQASNPESSAAARE